MENQNLETPEDFILNESFRNYVLGTDSGAATFWNHWLESHPDKESEFYQAVEILKVLLSARKRQVTLDKKGALKNLLANIEIKEQIYKPRVNLSGSQWLRIAAIALILIVVAVIWRWQKPSLENNDVAFNEIIVPIGEKAQVILSDNTHVWINSGSRFKYPVKYGSASREVFLDGEAYFDVTKQHGKPFIVSTRDVKIKVLGTAFNVKSYAKDKTVETTVVRGLVKVESLSFTQDAIFVNPNEKLIYQKESMQMDKSAPLKREEKQIIEKVIKPHVFSNINTEIVTCWKDQQLIFTDEVFEEMVVKMERWYNMKIQLKDTTLFTERYNGKFVHNETIYQVLEAIRLTTPINYTVKDNIIIISRK